VALHRLASITIGVPNVEDTCVYYSEFGLTRDGETLSTRDGGEQLRIVDSPYRRLFEFCVGADDTDDLERVTERLNRLGVSVTHEAVCVSAVDIHSAARVVVRVLPRSAARPVPTASHWTLTLSDNRTIAQLPSFAKNRSIHGNWVMLYSGLPTQKPRGSSS
jgi:hypothetical protein